MSDDMVQRLGDTRVSGEIERRAPFYSTIPANVAGVFPRRFESAPESERENHNKSTRRKISGECDFMEKYRVENKGHPIIIAPLRHFVRSDARRRRGSAHYRQVKQKHKFIFKHLIRSTIYEFCSST